MSKNVVVVGAGVVGLCVALYARQRGYGVTVIDRNPAERDGCSFGNAGMIVPSHFVPLASPGMVGRGLRWMWDPESPFYIKPRFSLDLLRWGLAFWARAPPSMCGARPRSCATCIGRAAAATRNWCDCWATASA